MTAVKPLASATACALLAKFEQAVTLYTESAERTVNVLLAAHTTLEDVERMRKQSLALLHEKNEAERALLLYISETEAKARLL